jgi:hypothetical protein
MKKKAVWGFFATVVFASFFAFFLFFLDVNGENICNRHDNGEFNVWVYMYGPVTTAKNTDQGEKFRNAYRFFGNHYANLHFVYDNSWNDFDDVENWAKDNKFKSVGISTMGVPEIPDSQIVIGGLDGCTENVATVKEAEKYVELY